MSKKAKKTQVQEKSFLDEAAADAPATATVQAAAEPKAKRTYKPRTAKAKLTGKSAVQAAWQAGFKAGQSFAEMGA